MKKQFIVAILIIAMFLVLSVITGIAIFSNWVLIIHNPVAIMTSVVALISIGMVVCSVIWLMNLNKEMPLI